MSGILQLLRPNEHRYCRENLSAYLDGRLTPGDRARVDRHIQECQACRWELDTLRQTVEALQAMPRVRAPRSFRLPHTVAAPSVPFWMRPAAYGALRLATGVAAALLIVALAGQMLVLPGTPGLPQPASEPMMLAAKSAAEDSATGVAAEPPMQPAPEAANGERALGATPAERGEKGPEAGATEAPAESFAAEPTEYGSGAGPTPEPTEWGVGGGPTVEPGAQGSDADPTADLGEPTLTAEEATRRAEAPAGMGGGDETTPVPETAAATATPAPPAEEIAMAAAATPAAQPTMAAQAEVPQLEGDNAPVERHAMTDGAEGEAVPAQGGSLLALRQRLSGYPWPWLAAISAVLFALLITGTLWLRKMRSRWP